MKGIHSFTSPAVVWQSPHGPGTLWAARPRLAATVSISFFKIALHLMMALLEKLHRRLNPELLRLLNDFRAGASIPHDQVCGERS